MLLTIEPPPYVGGERYKQLKNWKSRDIYKTRATTNVNLFIKQKLKICMLVFSFQQNIIYKANDLYRGYLLIFHSIQ